MFPPKLVTSPIGVMHFKCPPRNRHHIPLILFGVLSLVTIIISYTRLYSSWDLLSTQITLAVPQGIRNLHFSTSHKFVEEDVIEDWDPSNWLTGNITWNYEDNLRKDVQYITSGSCGGFTNMFMGWINLIYLASITNRVPIVPPFAPYAWLEGYNPVLPFSEVVDLPHLRETLSMAILDWKDVKQLGREWHEDIDEFTRSQQTIPEAEKVGCWSLVPLDHPGYGCLREDILNLDVAYTKPGEAYRNIHRHGLYYNLATLNPDDAPVWVPSQRTGHTDRPNSHMMCFDDLYFATSIPSADFEWMEKQSPVWRFVGRNARFKKGLEDIAHEYVTKILDVSQEAVPPFITMHIRHGDFGNTCQPASGNRLDCFNPLSEWAKLVEEVRQELWETIHVNATRVIVASDEKDPAFWDEVKSLGWNSIDHKAMQTRVTYGSDWYPITLDTVILSMGSGFVGTRDSTFSLLAKRRVEEWRKGVTRLHTWNP